MEHGRSSATSGLDTSRENRALGSLPDHPGDAGFYAHAAAKWKEQSEARLAQMQLLTVAQGQDPPAVRRIIDTDLDDLPMLPHTHRDYQRRLETPQALQNARAAWGGSRGRSPRARGI